MSIFYVVHYLLHFVNISLQNREYILRLGFLLPFFALIITTLLLYKNSDPKNAPRLKIRHVWVTAFFSLILINLIQWNTMGEVNLNLQHPIFMVVIAFAIITTGLIRNYRLLIAGGVIFAALAYTASFFALKEQLLIEAIAWVFAFVIPGHLLLARNSQ